MLTAEAFIFIRLEKRNHLSSPIYSSDRRVARSTYQRYGILRGKTMDRILRRFRLLLWILNTVILLHSIIRSSVKNKKTSGVDWVRRLTTDASIVSVDTSWHLQCILNNPDFQRSMVKKMSSVMSFSARMSIALDTCCFIMMCLFLNLRYSTSSTTSSSGSRSYYYF